MHLSEEEFQAFFEEVKERIDGIKSIVKKYGVEDDFAMSYIGGLYKESAEGGFQFAAQVDYVVTDEEELDEILAASLDLYRMYVGMTADEQQAVPEDLKDTEDWSTEDWMNFIAKNTKGDSN